MSVFEDVQSFDVTGSEPAVYLITSPNLLQQYEAVTLPMWFPGRQSSLPHSLTLGLVM